MDAERNEQIICQKLKKQMEAYYVPGSVYKE